MTPRVIMPGLVLLLCGVVISGSQNVDGQSCCTAKQYEIKAGGKYLDEHGLTSFYMSRLSIDFDKRQMASFDEAIEKYGNLSFIVDYKTMKMYTFSRKEPRFCTKTDAQQIVDGPCMPKDARFINRETLGYGNASLSVDNYGIFRRKEGESTTAYIGVTTQGCVPVSFTSTTRGRQGLVDYSLLYTDYNPGIKDPSVFDLPSYCHKAEEGDESDKVMPAALRALR